jgi:hypothetical protein
MRKTDLKIILPSLSSWSDPTMAKRRRDQKKWFHGGDIISALISPFGKKGLHVIMPVKLLAL